MACFEFFRVCAIRTQGLFVMLTCVHNPFLSALTFSGFANGAERFFYFFVVALDSTDGLQGNKLSY